MTLQTELSSDATAFSQAYVLIDKYTEARNSILSLIKYRCNETCGAILLAPSGCGKTTLVKKLLADYQEQSVPEQDKRFGIYVETPGSGISDLLRQLLFELGDNKPEYGTHGGKLKRIIDLVNNLNVKVVFLDEIQSMLPSSKLLPTSKSMKLIKELTNKTNCAWVLMGVPDAASIADVDPQLSDRFSRVICLDAFACNDDKNTLDFMEYLYDLLASFPRRAPFFKFMNELLTEDGFKLNAEIDSSNLLRFCLATKGKPRHIRTLLLEAIESTRPGEAVTKKVMAKAYQTCFQRAHDKKSKNPFDASIKKVKEELMKEGLYV